MNPLIEKKLAEFDMKWNPRKPIPQKDGEDVKLHLRTALQEALLAGIEMAERVVPESIKGCGRYGIGFNLSSLETLSRLAALKKEVVDGKV